MVIVGVALTVETHFLGWLHRPVVCSFVDKDKIPGKDGSFNMNMKLGIL